MRTFEEIRALLAAKFKKEKLRLKTYGTKADSFQLANVTARYVQALMAESRYRELRSFTKKILDKQPSQGDTHKIHKYITERTKATKLMSKAIRNMAEAAEGKRPWNSSNDRPEKKRKHGHNRSSRSRRD